MTWGKDKELALFFLGQDDELFLKTKDLGGYLVMPCDVDPACLRCSPPGSLTMKVPARAAH